MTVDLFQTVTGKEQGVHVGQIGQRFQAEIATDTFNLSTATRLEFAFKSPADVITRKTAVEVNAPSGENRSFIDEFGDVTNLLVQLEYTVTESTLFSTAGIWTRWVEIESVSFTHYGKATEFTVLSVGGV